MKAATLYKECSGCGEVLSEDCYWSDVSHSTGLASRCKECKRAERAVWMAAWRKKNPEKAKNQSHRDQAKRTLNRRNTNAPT